MSRLHWRGGALLALAVVLLGAAVAAGARPTARRASTSTLEVLGNSYGSEVLVDSAGFTVYEFTHDAVTRGVTRKDTCVTISGCTAIWPPLLVSEAPTAGPGVSAKLLGTIMLPGGGMQVTYKHHPLYTHAGDKPGELYYSGVKEFKGRWWLLTPAGKKV